MRDCSSRGTITSRRRTRRAQGSAAARVSDRAASLPTAPAGRAHHIALPCARPLRSPRPRGRTCRWALPHARGEVRCTAWQKWRRPAAQRRAQFEVAAICSKVKSAISRCFSMPNASAMMEETGVVALCMMKYAAMARSALTKRCRAAAAAASPTAATASASMRPDRAGSHAPGPMPRTGTLLEHSPREHCPCAAGFAATLPSVCPRRALAGTELAWRYCTGQS